MPVHEETGGTEEYFVGKYLQDPGLFPNIF